MPKKPRKPKKAISVLPLNPEQLPTKLIRRIAPEVLSVTSDLQKLCKWRQSLAKRRLKLEALRQSVLQMEKDLEAEGIEWEAEADRVANVPLGSLREVTSISEAEAQ
jgi:hypothetical protein